MIPEIDELRRQRNVRYWVRGGRKHEFCSESLTKVGGTD